MSAHDASELGRWENGCYSAIQPARKKPPNGVVE